MVHPRRFVRDWLGVALSQYVARAVVLVRGLLAAAALGPGGYGGWNALNLIFDYGYYASGGALQGLDLRLPGVVESGDRERARRLMAACVAVTMAGALAFGIALAVYLAAGGRAFSMLPGAGLPLLMLVTAWLQLGFHYLTAALRAHGRFATVSAGSALQAVLGGGLGIALVWRFGAWGLLAGWITGTVVALAWMRRGTAIPVVPAHFREGLALARQGFPIFAFFTTTLLLRSVDRLALIRYAGAEPLGLYSLGLMVLGLVLHLPEAAAYVLFPRIAAAFHGEGDRERVRADAVRAHRSLTLIVPLLVGVCVLFADPVVALLLPDYRAGVPSLRVLALAAMALSAATLAAYYLLAAGRQRLLVGVGVFGALVNGVLVFAVAARDPRPVAVASAAATGDLIFALVVVALAAREWLDTAGERLRLIGITLVPAIWSGAAVFALLAAVHGEGWGPALLRAAGFVAVDLPVVMVLGRGTGLVTLAREWLAARSGAVPS